VRRSPCIQAAVVPALILIAGCRAVDADLSRAIDADAGRVVTMPTVVSHAGAWTDLSTSVPGNDTLLHIPRSMCWQGSELFVADAGSQRIVVFGDDGRMERVIGGRGSGPGEFQRLSVLRCAPDGDALFVADPGPMRIQILGSDGSYRRGIDAPPTPQASAHLGEFAFTSDGRWYDSWFNAPIGPYYTGAQWDDVRLVRSWGAAGEPLGEFGEPFEYVDPVLRRVFNRVGLATHRDTLWVLSQANATVRSYVEGTEVPLRILLPVYHRGAEPVVELGSRRIGEWRENRANYQPNVQGLAVVSDTLFATIRYTNWRTVTVSRREGESYKDFWPDSAVDIFSRSGNVIASFSLPGRATQLSSDHRNRLSVLTEDLETGVVSVLVASLTDFD
jgi:hypothetical protein